MPCDLHLAFGASNPLNDNVLIKITEFEAPVALEEASRCLIKYIHSSLLLRCPQRLYPFCCSKTVKAVGGIPAELSAGQVQWAPPSENTPDGAVVFVGWEVKGQQFQTIKKLGMIYCFNRLCYLFAADAPSFGRSEG